MRTSAPVQVIGYLAVAFVAVRISPGKGFEVAAAVLAAFVITGPLRVVFGKGLVNEAIACLISATLLYVAIPFTVTAAGATLGEQALALALFVPAFAATLTVAIVARALLPWRGRSVKGPRPR